jgi:hypothetical protein
MNSSALKQSTVRQDLDMDPAKLSVSLRIRIHNKDSNPNEKIEKPAIVSRLVGGRHLGASLASSGTVTVNSSFLDVAHRGACTFFNAVPRISGLTFKFHAGSESSLLFFTCLQVKSPIALLALPTI